MINRLIKDKILFLISLISFLGFRQGDFLPKGGEML
jgi:hypothetical protein